MRAKSRDDVVRRHLLVSGKVQGVWFRESTRRQAVACGVAGWVRNLPDGRVEIEVEGPRSSVAALVRWAHEGPDHARVDGIEQHEIEPSGTARVFSVR